MNLNIWRNIAESIRKSKTYPCKFSSFEILCLKTGGYLYSDILYLETTGKDYDEIRGERNGESMKRFLDIVKLTKVNLE